MDGGEIFMRITKGLQQVFRLGQTEFNPEFLQIIEIGQGLMVFPIIG
jgi:hypothetical protein